MAWSPFQRANAGISWVEQPGDYANQIPTTPATGAWLFREDRRVSVLLPRKAGLPVGTRFISEGVEAIIQAAVREV